MIDNLTLKANILVYLYESRTYFTLRICILGTQMAIVSESYELSKQVKETQMILYHPMIERIIERNSTLYSRKVSPQKKRL